ncbi:MAG: hypothetical protein V1789_04495 [PVC group bacterium]
MKKQAGKKEIGSILDNLMKSSRFARSGKTPPVLHGSLLTIFGVPLIEQHDGGFLIDMTAVKVFSGIPGFVSSLAKLVVEKCRGPVTDILSQVVVDSESTPELAALGVTHVVVYARNVVARYLAEGQESFARHLRLIFDAIQTPKWGGLLFPRAFESRGDAADQRGEDENRALLFPFHTGAEKYFALLEYDRERHFLRITIEDAAQSRLFLKRIPHRVVKDSGRRHYGQDISTLAERIFTGIHNECQNQRDEYMEIPGRQPALFELLIESGLGEVHGAVFRWTREVAESLLLNGSATFISLLSKILVLLEDESVTHTLADGNVIEMVAGATHVYIDLSRKKRFLNLSIGERRPRPDMRFHLKKMPSLLRTLESDRRATLENYRVFLIHHATSEVLGFIKTLEEARCACLTTLFIRYRGIIPGFYLDDLLSLPDRNFHFYALQRLEQQASVEGAYILSGQFSSLKGMENLDAALRKQRGGYLDSMRLAAGHLFFREALAARGEGRKLLIIEDGGYIAPLLNRFCHAGKTLSAALEFFSLEPLPGMRADVPLKEWLDDILPATFEHTSNGYYQLRDVEQTDGQLVFPAFTIALSKYKNVNEAEACAYSILNAVESIFHGLGRSFMNRHVLVLGSRGNIGHFLFKAARERVSYGSVRGLDLKVPAGSPVGGAEYYAIGEMPEEEWKALDLFLGVTGTSVIQRDFLEKLIVGGEVRDIFFASGSTKTIEFSDVTGWIEELAASDKPVIGGYPVRLEKIPIRDPQTATLQGHRVRIIFADGVEIAGISPGDRGKNLYLLGDSMPINFLYYGVPGEVMDGVFEELFCLLTGFVAAHEKGFRYPPAIYAVDRNIDKHASLVPDNSARCRHRINHDLPEEGRP